MERSVLGIEDLMKTYKVKPICGRLVFCVEVPGSKSITNRALLLAALAQGKTILRGTLFSDDSRVFIQALKAVGYKIDVDEEKAIVTVEGGTISFGENRKVYVGSAGTAARFLTAMLALSGSEFVMEASKQMKKRPMKPLLTALEQLGVTFEYLENKYAFPFRICSYQDNEKEEVLLNIDESSQFLSALLMAGIHRKRNLRIRLTGKRSAKSYVEITKKMMKSFGVEIRVLSENEYEIPVGQDYKAMDYQIEPDVSAACYFYGIAALTGGTGTVLHVTPDSMQGDIQFLSLLEQMGCEVTFTDGSITLQGAEPGTLKGVEVDMSDFSDQTMTLAAMAPFLRGKTVIRNVAHIHGQESDRLKAIAENLKRLGIKVTEYEDGLEIMPGIVEPCSIHTYEDHRMAMAFTLTGCMADGIQIENPECCKKTFENFFEVYESILDLTN